MLHVTVWDMAGIRTDAQQWQLRRVQKKHLFQATGRQLHKEAFGCLWMKMLRKKHLDKQSIHISKQNGPKPRF